MKTSSAYKSMDDETLMRMRADIGDELDRRYQEAKLAQQRMATGRKFTLGGNPVGTSAQGEFCASFSELHKILGEPVDSDGYKVSTEWIITLVDGRVATIYDYKSTNLYDDDLPSVADFRAQPFYDWHVGGKGGGANLVEAVKATLFSSDSEVKP